MAYSNVRKSLIPDSTTCEAGRFLGPKTSFSAACKAPPFQTHGEKSRLD